MILLLKTLFLLPGFSLIKEDGLCHHIAGGLPKICFHINNNFANIYSGYGYSKEFCEEQCRELERIHGENSCAGYMYNGNYKANCYLFPSVDDCPAGFGYDSKNKYRTMAKTMNDLVPVDHNDHDGIDDDLGHNEIRNYDCYGRD